MAKHKIYVKYSNITNSTIEQFMEVAKSRDIHLLSRFLYDMPTEIKQKVIACNDYEIFVWAANNGYIEVMNKLLEEVRPKQKQQMITSNHFEALECAVCNDHIQVVKRLLEIASPEYRSSMIAISADIALKRNINSMLEAILTYANEEEKNIILEEAMEQGMIEGNHCMY